MILSGPQEIQEQGVPPPLLCRLEAIPKLAVEGFRAVAPRMEEEFVDKEKPPPLLDAVLGCGVMEGVHEAVLELPVWAVEVVREGCQHAHAGGERIVPKLGRDGVLVQGDVLVKNGQLHRPVDRVIGRQIVLDEGREEWGEERGSPRGCSPPTW